MKRKIKIALAIILGLVACYFLTRNFLLRKVEQSFSNKLKSRYGFDLGMSGIRMSGWTGILIENLVINKTDRDTLLMADSIYVQPSFFHLLGGILKLNELSVFNATVHLVSMDSVNNYVPEKPGKESLTKKNEETNYAGLLRRLQKKIFDLLPQQAELRNIHLIIDKDSLHEHISIPQYSSSRQNLRGILINNMEHSEWELSGSFSQDEQIFNLKVNPLHEAGSFPFVKNFFNGFVHFDTLVFRIDESSFSSGILKSKGIFHIENLKMVQPRLSDDTILVNRLEYSFRFSSGKNYLETDSTSMVRVNDLPVNIFARFEKEKLPVYSLILRTGKQKAGNFFASLPPGMFSVLQDVEADGNLDFALHFSLNAATPDDLVFDARMKKEKFRLRKYGSNSLLKMNSEFLHTAYERNRLVKSFLVGPSNPDFVPLEEISPFLRSAILTSEDGNFFYHAGFNEEAFRNSIAANFKAGKFVRGGSTITMQLVKNVYLTRHKTVARKAEEAIIVWLIENNHLVSKERMFEVYLNIIELGPGVYGVKEACRFYFEKNPSQLSLAESIFLASLLPHPKWFKYSFDEAGNMKPYLADYYRVVADFLLKKNLITEEDYNRLEPRVELKGLAKEMVIPIDTIPQDTLQEDIF